ncbi:MAG: hypothetical protein JRE81_11505 [Deltaproteobacteria bacterium]|jgi:hypothetical protein|nr:hypothetical protein [Deltaproteobacteria bacterium]
MPTPTAAFADAAAKYGDVDPEDIEAVQKWFVEELPTLSPETIERIFENLLARDGDSESRQMVPVYPDQAPLPSLSSSPPIASPLLAEPWKRLLSRLFGRLRSE